MYLPPILQICVWCWHHIMNMAEKAQSDGRCPACRTPYDKEKIVGMTVDRERLRYDTWRCELLFCVSFSVLVCWCFLSISCSQTDLWRQHGSQKNTKVETKTFWRKKATNQCSSGSKKSCLHCWAATWSSRWRCTGFFLKNLVIISYDLLSDGKVSFFSASPA